MLERDGGIGSNENHDQQSGDHVELPWSRPAVNAAEQLS
jgi:hypothetical protein